MTIHALLVAIDAYDPPINPLFGCRNDMAALEAYLHARAGDELRPLVLQDGEATRDSVTAAFRDHLGAAGPGDVALFAYFGHGSEEPAPAELSRAESTGRLQTILLHDCGRRVGGKLRRALADKELALLIAEVAARGPHVVTILDCCHAGGGTRDPFARPRSWRPLVDAVDVASRDVAVELAAARPATEFLPGTLDQWSAPRAPHVALGACRSDELAKEHSVGDVTRGAFSVALVESLDVLGTRTTYRSLLASVRARVERTAADQRPQLEPLDVGGLGDRLFLDGSVVPVSPTFTVSLGPTAPGRRPSCSSSCVALPSATSTSPSSTSPIASAASRSCPPSSSAQGARSRWPTAIRSPRRCPRTKRSSAARPCATGSR